MNWLQDLATTYDRCKENMADPTDRVKLLPVFHTTQIAQIEVTLDKKGNFKSGRVLPKEDRNTIIPYEESKGRTGSSPESYPLCDKLQYLARDFAEQGGNFTRGFLNKPELPYKMISGKLAEWVAFDPANKKIASISKYLERGTLIQDLKDSRILPDNIGTLPDSKTQAGKEEKEKFPVYAAMPPGNTPDTAFIRWVVEIPGEKESRTWMDPQMWESWEKRYLSTVTDVGFCQITGKNVPLAGKHPAKIRNSGDSAKLISANDKSGFTFRGRYTDLDGRQVCQVGLEVTQKAHSALRWLIGRQGHSLKTYSMVAWSMANNPIPTIESNTLRLFGEEIIPENNEPATAQAYAIRLSQKLRGYQKELGEHENIVILSVDSLSTGRLSITYYRKIEASEFLRKVEKWHNDTAWHDTKGKGAEFRKFIQAPSHLDIAKAAYGDHIKEALLSKTCQDLTTAMIDGKNIPDSILQNCFQRACNPRSFKDEKWKWRKAVNITCAIYRQKTIKEENHKMALDTQRTTRDYLYGRLLACADHIESAALHVANLKRDTSSNRLFPQFARQPYKTWGAIESALQPYLSKLRKKRPSILLKHEKTVQEIMGLFENNDFVNNERLSPEYLLAYHCQKEAIWKEINSKKES